MGCWQQYEAYWAGCGGTNDGRPPANPEAYVRCVNAFPANPGWMCRNTPALLGCSEPAKKTTAPPTTIKPITPVQHPPMSTPAAPSAPPTKAVVAKPPHGLNVPDEDVAAAKVTPPTKVDPANPPAPPTQKDFTSRVDDVIKNHVSNVDVVNGQARPRHWDCIRYDETQRPVLYNPLREGMSFRYYYQGEYREVWVDEGSSVVLDGINGAYPFTAVGNYLTTGSFYGGDPPAVYQHVTAYVPGYGQSVQLDNVTILGHDDSQPDGSQDTFMLDDSTLANGKADNPSDGGNITVTKTQTLPGVGPTDDANRSSTWRWPLTSSPPAPGGPGCWAAGCW